MVRAARKLFGIGNDVLDDDLPKVLANIRTGQLLTDAKKGKMTDFLNELDSAKNVRGVAAAFENLKNADSELFDAMKARRIMNISDFTGNAADMADNVANLKNIRGAGEVITEEDQVNLLKGVIDNLDDNNSRQFAMLIGRGADFDKQSARLVLQALPDDWKKSVYSLQHTLTSADLSDPQNVRKLNMAAENGEIASESIADALENIEPQHLNRVDSDGAVHNIQFKERLEKMKAVEDGLTKLFGGQGYQNLVAKSAESLSAMHAFAESIPKLKKFGMGSANQKGVINKNFFDVQADKAWGLKGMDGPIPPREAQREMDRFFEVLTYMGASKNKEYNRTYGKIFNMLSDDMLRNYYKQGLGTEGATAMATLFSRHPEMGMRMQDALGLSTRRIKSTCFLGYLA